jgi:outer membrane protein assembly factor BamB
MRLAQRVALRITLGVAALLLPGRESFAQQSEYDVAYQENTAHSGAIDFKAGFRMPLTKIWSQTIQNEISYPVIADGLVIFNMAEATNAYDLNTGTPVWKTQFTCLQTYPAYDNGLVFVQTMGVCYGSQSQVFALSSTTGTIQWTANATQLESFAAPVAQNGLVYSSSASVGATVFALNETDGSLAWQATVDGQDGGEGYFGGPALGIGGVYFTEPCQYYRFDAVTGKQDWRYNGPCEGAGGEMPAFFYGRLYAQDAALGNSIWDARTGAFLGTYSANPATPPAFYGTYAFSMSDGKLSAWSVKTGQRIWRHSYGSTSAAPIVVNGIVFAGDDYGNVYAYNRTSGKQLWTDKPTNDVSYLAAGEGTLVVICSDSQGLGDAICQKGCIYCSTITVYRSAHHDDIAAIPSARTRR